MLSLLDDRVQAWFKVAVYVVNIQHPRNVHFSNNYYITTAIYITVWGK